MRRLIGPVLGLALVAAMAGPALAAKNSSATLVGVCDWTLGTPGLQTQVDWSGYHPDNLTVVAWQSGTSNVTAFPVNRSVDWKFGTATWTTDYTTWSNNGVTFGPGTMVAVDLSFHGRFLAETNAVDAGSLAGC